MTHHFRRTAIVLACMGLVLGLALMAPVGSQPVAAQSAYQVYLPLVTRGNACGLSLPEEQIAQMMSGSPEQQRPSMMCDTTLAQVARERAEDMAQRDYFSHVNPDGFGPNYLVTQAGYVLPAYYDPAPTGNNIESIAAGYGSAEAAWQGWMQSSPHRMHLLGLSTFFAEQVEYGIGYAYDPASPYGHYWVVITARRGP